jgi:hypothetical protein
MEILLILIGLPVILLLAWLVERKDKWDDLDFYDDEEL